VTGPMAKEYLRRSRSINDFARIIDGKAKAE
jgi:hypothetical protein